LKHALNASYFKGELQHDYIYSARGLSLAKAATIQPEFDFMDVVGARVGIRAPQFSNVLKKLLLPDRKLPILEFEQLVSAATENRAGAVSNPAQQQAPPKGQYGLEACHRTRHPRRRKLEHRNSGKRSPALRQNIWFVHKMAIFDREVISERSMHARVNHGRTNLKEVVNAEVRC
jgi:hypothetical protein